MSYIRIRNAPDLLYHYTKKSNVESILKDGQIKKFNDTECWFCTSIENLMRHMELTIMKEGQKYYDSNGYLKHYPKFVADDFVVLELAPRYQNGEWVKWNQEYPPNTPLEVQDLHNEFSNLKIGFRGNLKFQANPQIIEVTELLQEMNQPAFTIQTLT